VHQEIALQQESIEKDEKNALWMVAKGALRIKTNVNEFQPRFLSAGSLFAFSGFARSRSDDRVPITIAADPNNPTGWPPSRRKVMVSTLCESSHR
jgi:hypothetical protein